MSQAQETAYRCPGESYAIARAVHLGRLTAFDPRCRGCEHRTDTASLPMTIVEQLQAAWQEHAAPLFDDEGASGLLGEVLDVSAARQLAAAFANLLCANTGDERPTVVLAGDGRPATAELVAAASDGVRLSGCGVIEIPSATTAALLYAQQTFQAHGALLIGNASGEARKVSLRFFGPRGRPISAECDRPSLSLDRLYEWYKEGMTRPARRYGGWRRGSVEAEYLAALSGRFHALRPLRFVLDTSCAPLARHLKQLLRTVGCRAYSPAEAAALPAGSPHFGIWIDGDGECLQIADEYGETVSASKVLKLLAMMLRADTAPLDIVVEDNTPDETVECLERWGAKTHLAPRSRSQIQHAMTKHQSHLAGGSGGRFWFASPAGAPDALQALSLLLNLLSQSDLPLSEVARSVG